MNDKKGVSVRKIFGDVFGIVFSRDLQKIYWPLCVISGFNWVLAVVSRFFFEGTGGSNLGKEIIFTIWWIILLILGSWMFLFELKIVCEGIDKKDVSWREAVTFANKNLLRSIGMGMILFLLGMLLMIIFGIMSAAIGLGLSMVSAKLGVIISGLLVFMGIICIIYVGVRLVLAPYHIFIGDRPVITGMVESWQASRERFWLIVRLVLSVLVCSVLVSLIVYGMGAVVGVLLSLLHKVIGVLVGGIIYVGFQPFILCFTIGTVYLLYKNLMVEEEIGEEEGSGNSGATESTEFGQS